MLILALSLITLSSCEKDPIDPEIHGLELSTGDEVTTDGTSFAFDVVDSYGAFTIDVPTVNGFTTPKVTVNGRHVTVDLIDETTYITVRDEGGTERKITVTSTNDDLKNAYTSIYQIYSATQVYTNLGFGTGRLRIVKGGNGDEAALMTIADDNSITVVSRHTGTSAYYVADSRGTVRLFYLTVNKGWDLTQAVTNVKAKAGTTVQFAIIYGAGQWKITDYPHQSPFNLVIEKGTSDGITYHHELLQLFIPTDATGTVTCRLKDKDGNTAEINIEVEATENS